MSRWDAQAKVITDDSYQVTRWNRSSNQVVQSQHKLSRPSTVNSKSSRSSVRWDHSANKIVNIQEKPLNKSNNSLNKNRSNISNGESSSKKTDSISDTPVVSQTSSSSSSSAATQKDTEANQSSGSNTRTTSKWDPKTNQVIQVQRQRTRPGTANSISSRSSVRWDPFTKTIVNNEDKTLYESFKSRKSHHDTSSKEPNGTVSQSSSSAVAKEVTEANQSLSRSGSISKWDPKTNQVIQVQRQRTRPGTANSISSRSSVRWDRNKNTIVAIGVNTTRPSTSDSKVSPVRWDRYSKTVVDLSDKTPRPRTSDSRSVWSEPAETYYWSPKQNKVVLNDVKSRWDYKTNRPYNESKSNKGNDIGVTQSTSSDKEIKTGNHPPSESGELSKFHVSSSSCGSKSSPMSVALFDINEDAAYDQDPIPGITSSVIRPNSSHRPYSADIITRKKRSRELKVKQLLNTLSKANSSIEENEAAILHRTKVKNTEGSQFMSLDLYQQVSNVTKLNDALNEKIARKDDLIEDQQKMIDDLMNQIETLSRQNNIHKIPTEVNVNVSGENNQGQGKNEEQNIFTQIFSPFFTNTRPPSNVSSLSITTDIR